MNYALPPATDELWRRTRPETFSLPQKLSSPSLITFNIERGTSNGVQIMTLAEGKRQFPSLFSDDGNGHYANDLERYTGEQATDGFLVYCESSVQGIDPLRMFLELSDKKDCALRNTIAIAPGAEVTLVESMSDRGGIQAFISTHVMVGSRAKLTYRRLQQWKRNVFSASSISLAHDARLTLTSLNSGQRVSKIEQAITLSGRNAHLDELFVDLGNGRSHIDLTLEVDHLAPRTFSRVEALGVIRDTAYSLHHGHIRIDPEAHGADTYFNSRHLLLTKRGRADSIPKLEIGTDDVQAGHGHTLSDVDSDALFYLMSRGIPRNQAVEMYVEGFLAPLRERFPDLNEIMR